MCSPTALFCSLSGCPWIFRGSQIAKTSLAPSPLCHFTLVFALWVSRSPARVPPCCFSTLKDSGRYSTVLCITDGVPCPPTGTLPAVPTFRSR